MTKRVTLERWNAVLHLLIPLFHLHWKEVGLGDALDMDFRAYSQAERAGTLLVVCLWDGGKLVGYWVLILTPFLHQRSVRSAHTDLLFVHPDFRSGGSFRALYDFTKATLIARGVKLWFVGEKLRRPLGKLFERYGFAPEEVNWVKRLEGKDG